MQSLPPCSESKSWRWGLVVAWCVMGWSFAHDISAPWTDNVDANGAAWSQSAHNTLRAGMGKTAGVPSAFYFGSLPIPPEGYYTHHPPTLSLMLTGMFAALGEKEWVARLLPISFSLAGVALLWLLVKQCVGARAAAFSAIAFASMPMELVYGRMVNFEPLVLVWMLAAMLSLRRWEAAGSAGWRNTTAAFLVLAMWTAWLGFLFVLTLCAYFLIARRQNRSRFALSILVLAVVSLGLFFLHIRIANPNAWSDLMQSFHERLGRTGIAIPWSAWGKRMIASLADHITPLAWTLGAAGGIVAWRRRNADASFRWLGWSALGVAAFSAFYVVAFRNASMIHDYASFFFTVPVAMMAGIALDTVAARCERRRRGGTALGFLATLGACIFLIVAGEERAQSLRRPFHILDAEKPESADLIPMLGRAIREYFPEETNVICNFLRYYAPHLHYYAQHDLITDVVTPEDWKEIIADESNAPLGGVIWLGDVDAGAVIAKLSPGASKEVEICGEHFVFWKPPP